ncbi:hypothetical protein M433DRAFT_147478 [Acidomyces richmondensis BFW]|nr:MAG: hypothetical protein FE78DRAFT_268537 [Acidomyces sp. 'richmondensis']KYG41668.1 hypothetical protein M433DRAFT_147478 [Acidomyces richmondensis BFW]
MTLSSSLGLSFPERLSTFDGFWDENPAAARQLAAIGHVYDRPPLEALEEGTRCISCNNFIRREISIRAFEGPLTGPLKRNWKAFEGFDFHYPGCLRLQVRMPLDPRAIFRDLQSFRFNDVRSKFEHDAQTRKDETATPRAPHLQTSGLFSLPTELRLEIYAHILPQLDVVTEIVACHGDSCRVMTKIGHEKTGRRDDTKPNLLRTCKRVHDEARDILFSKITYKFASSKLLYLWLRAIGHHGRQLVTAVDVQCGSREDAMTFSLLATCPKLRSITIRLFRPRLVFPHAPLWIIDGVACLLSLRGLEDVRFGDCGPHLKTYMDDSNSDAGVIRRELTRPKGSESGVRWVDGHLDI